MLLTRAPLTSREHVLRQCVRLACIRHAASVRPEPGSNSHNWLFELLLITILALLTFFKLVVVQRNCLVVCSVEQIPLHIWCVYLCSVFNELSLSFCWTTTFIVYHIRAVVVNTFLKVFLTSFRSDVVCFNNFYRVSRLWLEVNNFFEVFLNDFQNHLTLRCDIVAVWRLTYLIIRAILCQQYFSLFYERCLV